MAQQSATRPATGAWRTAPIWPEAQPSQRTEAPHREPRLAPSLAILLKHSRLFAGLTDELAQALVPQCRKVRLDRGDLIVRQGERSHSLYLLLSGRAHLIRTNAQGKEVIIEVLHAGDHLGEMALIDGLPHSTSARCEDSCDVLEIQGGAFAACLVASPEVAEALTQTLVQRLRGAYRRIAGLAHSDVGERLHQQLVALAVEEQGDLILRPPLVRRDLAKMIGASREMVSRTMSAFEDEGLLVALPGGSWRVAPLGDAAAEDAAR